MNAIAIISLAALFTVCVGLAFWCEYEDGIVGHAALALMATMSGLTLLDIANGSRYEFSEMGAWLYLGMAMFMLRHAMRAFINVSNKRKKERANAGKT